MASETGEYERNVVMDKISVMERTFVHIVEAMRASLGEAIERCLLAMRDIRDNNGGGEVFGLATIGDDWRMGRYDGRAFQMTEKFMIFAWFDTQI